MGLFKIEYPPEPEVEKEGAEKGSAGTEQGSGPSKKELQKNLNYLGNVVAVLATLWVVFMLYLGVGRLFEGLMNP